MCIFTWLLKTNYLRVRILEDLFEFFSFRPIGAKKLIKQWQKTKGRLETELESEYKLAVIEADSALDEILKKMGYPGDTIGEKLEKINVAVLPSVEEVREAHKIRNNIVHDPDYRINLDGVKKVITIYEKALTDLGAL